MIKKKQFIIKTDKRKISMKVNNEEDKYLFIDKVSLAKDNLMKISFSIDNIKVWLEIFTKG